MLISADENYIAMLEVVDGKLQVNQAAYQNIVAAELMSYKAKLLDAAAAEIEQLALNNAAMSTDNLETSISGNVEALNAETAAFNANSSAAIANSVAKAQEAGVDPEAIQGVFDKYTEIWNASLNSFNTDFTGFMGAAGGSAGGAAGDAYVDAFNKELEQLKYLRENGIIDEREYLSTLKVNIIAFLCSNTTKNKNNYIG